MEHYAIVLDWSTENECETEIIDIAHSMEEAKEVFQRQLVHEKKLAEKEGWHVFEDSEGLYEAFNYGNYEDGHTKLWIARVKTR